MDKLSEKLNHEFLEWVDKCLELYKNFSVGSVLDLVSYEYCIKDEICQYFYDNALSDDFRNFLLSKDNTLGYLYEEYISDDAANIHDVIDGFISNVIYKFKIEPSFDMEVR